jgi:hypothetical protein
MPLDRALTPALLMTSMHFSKDLNFPSGSFVVTSISTGILPPFSGSRCLAEWTPFIQQKLLHFGRNEFTFLRSCHNINSFQRKDEKRGWKLVT